MTAEDCAQIAEPGEPLSGFFQSARQGGRKTSRKTGTKFEFCVKLVEGVNNPAEKSVCTL